MRASPILVVMLLAGPILFGLAGGYCQPAQWSSNNNRITRHRLAISRRVYRNPPVWVGVRCRHAVAVRTPCGGGVRLGLSDRSVRVSGACHLAVDHRLG